MNAKREHHVGDLGLEDEILSLEIKTDLQIIADTATRELLAEIAKLRNLRIELKKEIQAKSEIMISSEQGAPIATGELTLAEHFEGVPAEIESMLAKLLNEIEQLDSESISLDFLRMNLILKTANYTLELVRLMNFTQKLPTALRKKLILLGKYAQAREKYQSEIRKIIRELPLIAK